MLSIELPQTVELEVTDAPPGIKNATATSVMKEVVDYQQPAPTDSAPPWLLGQIDWDDRQVPVFSFTALIIGSDVGEITQRAKIMSLKSLNESGRVSYLGILLGDPHPSGRHRARCGSRVR